MNFTGRDIGLFISMAIAIIMMSFMFPALGMGGENVQENEIPEYNLSTDKYDFAGEFPADPGAPSQGIMVREENNSDGDRRQVWLHGDTTNGFDMGLWNKEGNLSEPVANITMANWTDSSCGCTEIKLGPEGSKKTVEHGGYKLQFHFESVEEKGTGNMTMNVRYTIIRQPENTEWYSRIPVVGSVMGAGEQLAGVVGWIGSVFYWLFGQVITIFTNMFVVFYETIVYFTATAGWLTNTYLSIISAAPGYASVLVMIPGILLFMQFAKMGMVAVDILWIG